MGGYGCDKLQVLEMSEETGFTWTVKADLPATRRGAASVAYEGNLWLIGGAVDNYASSSVVIYDIDADSWGTGPELPREAYGARATTLNGEVHVIGSAGQCWAYRGDAWVGLPGGPGLHCHALAYIRLG